jgi:polar amino acid transport system substrate-binding protein
MLRKVTLVVLLIAGTIVALLGCRPAQTRIVVGTDATCPPMESRDANGKIVGIDIDIMNEIGKAEKITIEYQNIPWDAIFSRVQQGSIDAIISSITILDWRKTNMDFSLPYISAPQVIVVKKGTTGIETTNDLYNKRVGVLKGSKTIGQMQDKASDAKWTITEYSNTEEFYYGLVGDRVDAIILDKVVAGSWENNPEDSRNIKVVGTTEYIEDWAIAVKKGNQSLLKKINAGIEQIRKSGLLDSMIRPVVQ